MLLLLLLRMLRLCSAAAAGDRFYRNYIGLDDLRRCSLPLIAR